MKFVMSWTPRPSTGEAELARSLQIFAKWSPPETVTFHQFVGRIDARGGYAFVETDDVLQLNKDIQLFAPFLDFDLHPVEDIAATAQNAGEAVALRQSIS